MADDMQDRLLDLEVKVAYQDHTIAALDQVVRALADRLARAEAELERARAGATTTARSE
jgi:uncharacterized coiled-coil protein SlyX